MNLRQTVASFVLTILACKEASAQQASPLKMAPEMLLLFGFYGAVIFGIFLVAAFIGKRSSNRYPKLIDDTRETRKEAGLNEASADVKVRIDSSLKTMIEGNEAKALEDLTRLLEELIEKGAATPSQIAVLEPLIAAHKLSGAHEAAKRLENYLGTLRRDEAKRAEGNFSLFSGILRNQDDTTDRVIGILEAIQTPVKPFVRAHLSKMFWVSFLVLVAVATIAIPTGLSAIAIMVCAATISMLYIIYEIYRVKTSQYEFRDGMLVVRFGGISRNQAIFELYRLHDVNNHQSILDRASGDCLIKLSFDHKQTVRLRGLVKKNEALKLCLALRETSRALRANSSIKGILT